MQPATIIKLAILFSPVMIIALLAFLLRKDGERPPGLLSASHSLISFYPIRPSII